MNRLTLYYLSLVCVLLLISLHLGAPLFALFGKRSWSGILPGMLVILAAAVVLHFLSLRTEGYGLFELVKNFTSKKESNPSLTALDGFVGFVIVSLTTLYTIYFSCIP